MRIFGSTGFLHLGLTQKNPLIHPVRITTIALLALSQLPTVSAGEGAYQVCKLSCTRIWGTLAFNPGDFFDSMIGSSLFSWASGGPFFGQAATALRFVLFFVGGTEGYCASACTPARIIPWF